MRACRDRSRGIARLGVPGEYHHEWRGLDLPHLCEHIESRAVGQRDVEEKDIRFYLLNHSQRFCCATGFPYDFDVVGLAESFSQGPSYDGVVFG